MAGMNKSVWAVTHIAYKCGKCNHEGCGKYRRQSKVFGSNDHHLTELDITKGLILQARAWEALPIYCSKHEKERETDVLAALEEDQRLYWDQHKKHKL